MSIKEDWQSCVDRVRKSQCVINGTPLSEHFFLGYTVPAREQANHPLRRIPRFEIPDKAPALMHESAANGHILLVGPTGLNKTTIGQAGLLLQTIQGRRELHTDESGQVLVGLDGDPIWRNTDPQPTVIIDLKGDPALKNATEEATSRRSQRFRAFTLEQGKATSFFNPLENLHYTDQPVIEYCELLLNALDLYHGDFSYGTGYFSEMCRSLLLLTLRNAKKRPRSWAELYELLNETLDRRQHHDVFELLGRIFAMASYPVLGPAPSGIDVIHMPEVVANNECVYFSLPALGSAMSVVAIAKTAILSFLSACRAWNNSGKKAKRGWLFIDEAQIVVGRNVETFFQQSSGSKVNLVSSVQSLANLDTRDAPNLSRTMWTNSRMRQAFGLSDPLERKNWIELSGERSDYTESLGPNGNSWHEVVHPRLNHNVINAVGNTAGASLFSLVRDAGLTEYYGTPCQLWSPYPISLSDYQRYLSTPWPDAPETTNQGGRIQTTVVNEQPPKEIEAVAQQKYASIENLFFQISKRSGRRQTPATGQE